MNFPSRPNTDITPEQQNTLVHRLRLRLVELCQEKKHWLANGRCYLDDDLKCIDSKTGQEMNVLWWGGAHTLEFDRGNYYNRKFFQNSNTWHDLFFFLVDEDGKKSEEIEHVKMVKLPDNNVLLRWLSEGSVQIQKIDEMRRHQSYRRTGDFWPREEIVLRERQNDEDKLLCPHALTMITRDGHGFSYWKDSLEYSFADIQTGGRWYPNFSQKRKSEVVKKHGREYVEVGCYSPNLRGYRTALLSRPENFGYFDQHHVSCGTNKIEVMHLVGDRQAAIKLNNTVLTVALRDDGELEVKQGRYFHVSQPKTFWYDLKTNNRLDHEPS